MLSYLTDAVKPVVQYSIILQMQQEIVQGLT